MLARDIMDTRFHTLRPETTIAEAVKSLQVASREEGKRIFGLMVMDHQDRLAGMLSMYDILLTVQPKHIHIWGEMDDLDPDELFLAQLERAKHIQVKDIMSTDVITISADAHVVRIVEIMLKMHIRRIPVIEKDEIVGIVYRSNVFYHLLNKFID